MFSSTNSKSFHKSFHQDQEENLSLGPGVDQDPNLPRKVNLITLTEKMTMTDNIMKINLKDILIENRKVAKGKIMTTITDTVKILKKK